MDVRRKQEGGGGVAAPEHEEKRFKWSDGRDKGVLRVKYLKK